MNDGGIYEIFLLKMAFDNHTNQQVKLTYENFCDLKVFIKLACFLYLLEFVHVSLNLHN
jgi:hypothetical protein